MRRALVPGVVASVAVVAVAAIGWLVLDDDDGDELPPVGSLALPEDRSTDAPPDPARDELEELLLGGRSGAVHAVYESEGDTTELGGDMRLEVWRADGRARYDTLLTTPDGTTGETVVVVGEDGGTSCTRTGDEPFACSDTEETSTDLLLLGPPSEGRDVEAYDDEIGGVDARCFRTDDELGRSTVCVDGAGVPVLLQSGDARLLRVSLDDDVPDSVFDTASLAAG